MYPESYGQKLHPGMETGKPAFQSKWIKLPPGMLIASLPQSEFVKICARYQLNFCRAFYAHLNSIYPSTFTVASMFPYTQWIFNTCLILEVTHTQKLISNCHYLHTEF